MMYVINPSNGAVSTHSATTTAIVEHDGALYGASGVSLYGFTGAPTGFTLTTGALGFGTNRRKGIPNAYVGLKSGGKATMALTAGVQGREKTLGPYLIAPVAGSTEKEYRTRTGKGHAGATYSISVSAAGDAKLRYIDLEVHPRRGDN